MSERRQCSPVIPIAARHKETCLLFTLGLFFLSRLPFLADVQACKAGKDRLEIIVKNQQSQGMCCGVNILNQGFQAYIYADSKKCYLGTFDTEVLAARIYGRFTMHTMPLPPSFMASHSLLRFLQLGLSLSSTGGKRPKRKKGRG